MDSYESSIQRSPSAQELTKQSPSEDDVLETMIPSRGPYSRQHSHDDKYWGHFAGLSLLQRMRKLCGQVAGLHQTASKGDSVEDDFVQSFDTAPPPESTAGSWDAFALLPSKDRLIKCVDIATDQACCLLNFLDRNEVSKMVDRIQNTDNLDYSIEDRKSLALLFAILALGRRFEVDDTSKDRERSDKNIAKGYGRKLPIRKFDADKLTRLRYFRASRSMLDVADCHDITSLQTVLCLIIYLQASSMLSTCYSYICAGVAASLRMGLHSNEALGELPMEKRQVRRCIFAVLNIMGQPTPLNIGPTLKRLQILVSPPP